MRRSVTISGERIAAWWALAAALCLLLLFYFGAWRADFSFQGIGPAGGARPEELNALVLFMLIAASTLVSEDLTCVGAGVLAAQGRTSFALAAASCLAGIFVGDVLLFLAGRYLGRPALRRAPLKWFVRARDVERSSAWFRRRGYAVIILSRFLPGTRLPTYVAAGLLDTSFWKFSLYFLAAASVWTPLLVGLSMLVGAEATKSSLLAGRGALVELFAAGVLAFIASKLAVRLLTWRGRALFAARLRRLVRWEFWPPWAFYPPVLIYVVLLALRHRGLTAFTCANPAIPAGGFVGESKIDILRKLSAPASSSAFVARAGLIGASLSPGAQPGRAREFMKREGLSFPVVLKPDVGQRGAGVLVVRSEGQLEAYLRETTSDTIIQEYVSGFEFGVFYVRRPGDARGRIFSVTDKRFPTVEGDGESTLEQLILRDERAVLMARTHFERHRERLWDIPRAGETVRLVELGTHCRGSLFLDGGWVITPALDEAIDRLGRGFEGFYFGRFDIRTPSVGDFQKGRNFKVVELNGVTSEATSIYDPRNSLLTAYRTIFEQWRLAFEVGAENRARGVRPTPVSALLRLIFENFRHDESRAEGEDDEQRVVRGNKMSRSGDVSVVEETHAT